MVSESWIFSSFFNIWKKSSKQNELVLLQKAWKGWQNNQQCKHCCYYAHCCCCYLCFCCHLHHCHHHCHHFWQCPPSLPQPLISFTQKMRRLQKESTRLRRVDQDRHKLIHLLLNYIEYLIFKKQVIFRRQPCIK